MNRSRLQLIFWALVFFIAGFVVSGCATFDAGGTDAVSGATSNTGEKGSLKLVSLGTGDTDNMTLRASQAVAQADIALTMGGSSKYYPELLKGKTIYNAGHRLFFQEKDKSGHGATSSKQKIKDKNNKHSGPAWRHKSPEELDAQREKLRKIIRDAVAAGKHVVIIDNGDPTIFGPHIGYMREFADLNPEVVPGISSFNAANAALQTSMVAGKSLGVTLTLGSLKGGRDTMIANRIKEGETMIFFMVRDLNGFITGLNGQVPADTPVAIVSWAGSRENQRIIRGTMETILDTVGNEKVPNYLLYVGTSLK